MNIIQTTLEFEDVSFLFDESMSLILQCSVGLFNNIIYYTFQYP